MLIQKTPLKMTTSPPPSLPPDYEELEFKIEEEEWNEYELEDGVRIKGRIFLAKIMRDPNDPKKMNFDILPPKWSVYAPTPLRGIPSIELIQDPMKQKDAEKYRVRITRSHEPWNLYKILRTGQEIKIKLAVDEVLRFKDAYDQNGTPFYSVPNGVAITIKDNQPQHGQ
jgi:hypothetical protein